VKFLAFLKNRANWVSLALIAVFGVFFFMLFQLQIVQGDQYFESSQNQKRREIRITGTRGKILDTNGTPLAYMQKAYDIQFTKDPTKNKKADRAEYTQVILKTIRLIRDNGDAVNNTGAITMDEQGQFVFSWGVTAEEAMAAREKYWRNYMGLSAEKYPTAADCYWYLRSEWYQIPAEVDDEEALLVLSVWQNVASIAYQSYIPVTIASNVSRTVVALIEMNSEELTGVNVAESSVRVYPKGTLAAHLIGYLGRMSDEDTIISMEAQGYNRDDKIGVAGIEASMESQLSGCIGTRTGVKVVEINAQSKVIREYEDESVPATAGNDVVLTIDVDMQTQLEKALEANIKEVRAKQEEAYEENQEEYDQILAARSDHDIAWCEYGAAVVMNVQTGEVLASASYPGYDLNLFGKGIQIDELNDLLYDPTYPLMNKAISSQGTPGSIYKMATSLAGLMEGVITLDTRISDQGEFRDHLAEGSTAKGPSCWKRDYTQHANQTVIDALKNSCNYFFYKVSYGLGIDRLNYWVSQLGLDTTTGIELPGEAPCVMGNQSALYDPDKTLRNLPVLVRNNLIVYLREKCEELGMTYTDEKYAETAEKLMRLAVSQDTHEYGADLRNILRQDLKITASGTLSVMSADISQQIYQLIWNDNHTILTGIGQSVTLVTPMGVARYLSTLVNGGNVYEAQLVDKILYPTGEIMEEKQPQLIRTLDVPASYLAAIKEGMREVVSEEDGGTAASAFRNFKYNGQFGGKTGTAQVSNIDLENNAWFICFAPFDQPEIAIVVYLPHGYSGANACSTAKEMIAYYLERKAESGQAEILPEVNGLTY